MAVTTTIARHYALKQLFAFVLCLVFGLWGVYDYVWKIPAQQKAHTDYVELKPRLQHWRDNPAVTAEEQKQQQADIDRAQELAPDGVPPAEPNKWDHLFQWAFILCLPFAPYFLWLFIKTRRRVYHMDDDGALHLPASTQTNGQPAVWSQQDIADIDMSRWMKKSKAWVVHRNGTRVELDDYKHKNLHLIIGAIASRLYPEQWTPQAKIVKADEPATEGQEMADLPEDELTSADAGEGAAPGANDDVRRDEA